MFKIVRRATPRGSHASRVAPGVTPQSSHRSWRHQLTDSEDRAMAAIRAFSQFLTNSPDARGPGPPFMRSDRTPLGKTTGIHLGADLRAWAPRTSARILEGTGRGPQVSRPRRRGPSC